MSESAASEESTSTCSGESLSGLELYWCELKTELAVGLTIEMIAGILLIIGSILLAKFGAWIFDRVRPITGTWLLAIKDDGGHPVKFDKYRLRQSSHRLQGKIRRIHSQEDAAQSSRRYSLTGFAEGQNVVYAFWPSHKDTKSFGTCNLALSKDKVYAGWYTRPVSTGQANKKQRKKKTAAVVLTRSPQEVMKLIADLDDDDRARIMKAIYPFRYRKHMNE